MLDSFSVMRNVLLCGLLTGFLFACSSNQPAPVESRTPGRPVVVATGPEMPPPPVARPGYYIVKKGDTLYSIAHQFERDYRDLAILNNLGDPNVISIGQELRVAVLAESRPVVLAPPIATASAPGANPAPVTVAPTPQASNIIKTEPKGGRLAYSPQAWKDLQGLDKPLVPVAASSAPAARVEPKPVAQSAPVESKPMVVAAGDDDVDWMWPGSGKILATFNDSSNKGVDIAGNAGDPVLAAGAGKVVYVGNSLRGYGNLVIIKHNNSFLSAYAHNSEILVKEGQSVQKGQKIAAVGSSDTDRTKLHFEVRRQGKPVDPLKYLPAR